MASFARVIRYVDETPLPNDGRLFMRASTIYIDPSVDPSDVQYGRILAPDVYLDSVNRAGWSPAIKAAVLATGLANGYADLVEGAIFIPAYAVGSEVDVALPTGVTSDWDPGGVGDEVLVRIYSTVDAVTQIDGIAGGYPGRILHIKNDSLGIVQLVTFMTGSLPANRFSAYEVAAPSIPAGFNIDLYYSGVELRWKTLRRLTPSQGLSREFQFGLSGQFATPSQFSGTPVLYVPASDSMTLGGLIASGRVQEAMSANVASAATITLPITGNLIPVTGTTTVDGIVTTGWQAGSRVRLRLASGIPITHNSGAPGAGAVAILLRASANLVTAKAYTLELDYDGTNWIQPD